MEQIVIYFFNGTDIKFKTKDSETVAHSLCLGNISKDFYVDNMKKTGLILMLIIMLLQLLIF